MDRVAKLEHRRLVVECFAIARTLSAEGPIKGHSFLKEKLIFWFPGVPVLAGIRPGERVGAANPS
jgi:hypothetical protein